MLKKKPKKKVAPAKPKARRIYPVSQLRPGLKEEVYYFKQGNRIPSFRGRTANMYRRVPTVQYAYATGGKRKKYWKGFTSKDHFAVRWSGVLVLTTGGNYRFHLASDDGSNLYIDNRKVVNNDGAHGSRWAKTRK